MTSIAELVHMRSWDIDADMVAGPVTGMEITGILIDGKDADDSQVGIDLEIEQVAFFLKHSDATYKMTMYHEQDCCEYVRLVDVAGSWAGLLGRRIVRFSENVNEGEDCTGDDSCTWTFYDISVDNGEFLTMRWLGESNGYYSESVDFRFDVYDEVQA